MNTKINQQTAAEGELLKALERNELVLHYQPQCNLDTRNITGIEALVRWQHPERGLLPPSDFIPVAEQSGLITRVGNWVLEEACRQQQAWVDRAQSTWL